MNSYPHPLKAVFDLPLRFWIVALIAFINTVSFTILIPILYPYAKEFGLSDFQASLLVTSYSVSQFLATPLLGRASDALGRKPLLVLSLAGTVIFPTLPLFVMLAILLGIVNAFPLPLINSILSIKSTDQQQGEVLGLNSAYLSISNAIGPAVAGLLVSASYNGPFWIAGALTLLTAGFALSFRGMLQKPSSFKI